MAIYYHQLNPFLIQFSENFGIRWYSLAYMLGAFAAYVLGVYFIRKGRLNLPETKLMDIIFIGALGAVLGGRLGYCVFYSQDLLFSFDKAFPFWGLLKIHEGGMASHGGIIGFFLFQVVYAYRHKLSFFSLMDLGAISGAVGIFFGRIANFINGELYGRVIEGKAWLAVKFPSELFLWADQADLYKKQLMSLKEILPPLKSLIQSPVRIPEIYSWENWVSKAAEGDSVYGGYIAYVCNLIVQVASKPQIKEILEPLLSLRHPSQLYQASLGGLIPFIICYFFWLKPRKAGLISLIWACSYLFFRIVTEFYRQPDIQIGFQLFNLTRGQWISVGLFFFVAVYAGFIYKKEPQGFSE